MPTANYNIWTPNGQSSLKPLQTPFITLAESVDDALGEVTSSIPTRSVANQAERTAMYPTPVQGDSVYRLDRGWVERYYGVYNASTNPGGKSVAGWYAPSGTIIRSVRDNWPDGGQPIQTSSSPFIMRRLAIADPGVPYRIQGYGVASAGSLAAGTRWDMAMGVTNTNSNTVIEDLGQFSSSESSAFQTITSLPSAQVLTGNKDIILQLIRVVGSAQGQLNPTNHRLQYTMYAA